MCYLKITDNVKIIFITIAYPHSYTDSNLYTDLMEKFAQHGHQVYVACSTEKRFGNSTNINETNGLKVLRIKTGNITSNPNYFTKLLALLKLQTQFIKAIDKYFGQIKFDLIIYSTPPIQYNRIIKYLKSKSNASTYLLLKDIFPQNAVDIGLLNKWNPIYWYFRHQEKITYKLSDRIGCMSPANVNYLIKHNPTLNPNIIEVCANSLKETALISIKERISIRSEIRKRYSIKEEEILLVYGGNLGIAQGLSFLLEILKHYFKNKNVRFLIVGDGTCFKKIQKFQNKEKSENMILQKRVSSAEFREILFASDIGLIFLNPKFSIPNFPSRLNSYLQVGLPVIACTDKVSDIGDIVEKAGCGYKVISEDIQKFNKVLENIMSTPGLLENMSLKARDLFEKEYTTLKSYSIIMKDQH